MSVSLFAARRPLSRIPMANIVDHIHGRIQQLRKVKRLAHDPRMIEMIQRVIDEAEADIVKLEAESDRAGHSD